MSGGGEELLTVEEMYLADRFAIEAGTSGERLMEAAGEAVTSAIMQRWEPCDVSVLAGPGGNGGDGFVVARLLKDAGWPVRIGMLDHRKIAPETQLNMRRWQADIGTVSSDLYRDAELVVDALYGAGLERPLDDDLGELFEHLRETGLPCVSIDLPSGVHGDTGRILGSAPYADLTVTFFRRKPGHLLFPGRERAGTVVTADIGIPPEALDAIAPTTYANQPELWSGLFPWPHYGDHKYRRGHAVIAGGSSMTGAARLAARAARRIGAGLVTVAAGPESLPLYAADAPGLLTEPFTSTDEFRMLLGRKGRNAILVGPGMGVNRTTLDLVRIAATSERSLVVDADGLTVFADRSEDLFRLLQGTRSVITPHEGEFARLFNLTGSRLDLARTAADRCGCVVLLKGADTVIAGPCGRAAINANAPPTLATAGTGDVLAGLIVGLMAQGMPPFEAACAGTWLHGAAAKEFGPGLIAEDLCETLPSVLCELDAVYRDQNL